MIAIISSIIIAISVLVASLIAFTPNARVIMESDFIRTARNNAYLATWEYAQLNVRTDILTPTSGPVNVALGYLSKKGTTEQQSLTANISYDPTDTTKLKIQLNN